MNEPAKRLMWAWSPISRDGYRDAGARRTSELAELEAGLAEHERPTASARPEGAGDQQPARGAEMK